MDATYLTAVRTGAASAVATKYMARREAASVGLVGSGVQATFQLLAISKVRNISEVFAWSPDFDRPRRDAFIEETKPMFPELDLIAADDIDKAAIADIVVTTTPSRGPVLMDPHIGPGTHINAVGADGPGKQELDPAILKRSRVIVDEWEQAWHGGEINVPLASGELSESDIDGSLDQVVNGDIPGRTSEDEITIFDSTGLAIEDIAVAILVYERALKEGAGSEIEL
jgi:alanine dehydrogenase